MFSIIYLPLGEQMLSKWKYGSILSRLLSGYCYAGSRLTQISAWPPPTSLHACLFICVNVNPCIFVLYNVIISAHPADGGKPGLVCQVVGVWGHKVRGSKVSLGTRL